MRALFVAAALSLLSAAPSLAQTERGYITGVGGFTASTDGTKAYEGQEVFSCTRRSS